MLKKVFGEFITGCILVLLGSVVTLLPIFNVTSVKVVLVIIMAIYIITSIIKNIIVIKEKDYSGFFVACSSFLVMVFAFIMDINNSPWNLALLLFIWVIANAFIKLKKSDYYHDKNNKLWVLNIVNLVIFILVGIVCSVNLNYTGDIQILVIGFFFLVNGILELNDPLVKYIFEE